MRISRPIGRRCWSAYLSESGEVSVGKVSVGILKTGQPPAAVGNGFGDYPAMFRKLLGEDAYHWTTYAVDEGQLPEASDACDAYIVTGSASGVYEPLPWIGPAMAFLNTAKGRVPLVGVCFGHQLMAQAFGGKVIKSPKGWGVGQNSYEVRAAQSWMAGEGGPIRLPASHQDQVVELPPGAEVWASNPFCEMGALVWPAERAVSIQLHPEFEPDYAIALINSRRGARFPDDQADAAVATYAAPDDRAKVGRWIGNFLKSTG